MSVSKIVSKDGGQNGRKRPGLRAVMGCYVEVTGEEDILYGVTCNHVTRYAAEDVIYIESSCKHILRFGQVIERQSHMESSEPNEDIINANSLKSPDIDIFEITSAITRLCKPVYRNASSRVVSCRLFKGDIQKLYGKEVFQCSVHGAQKASFPKFGQIASLENHKRFESTFDLSNEFIVYGKDGNFASGGDSGRMVAIEVGDDKIEVIGIIVSGEYTGKETDSDEPVCICLSLKKGLEYLSREYGKEFTLSVSENHTVDVKRRIEPNQMILYKNPEYSIPTNFDLVDQLLLLKNCLNLKVTGELEVSLETVVQFEEDLRQKVYQRKDLEWKNVDYPTADQKCIHKALLACENIYTGDLKQAEECLKEAYSMISHNCCFRLRLLCMMFCYSAWVLLETDNLKKACTLLENGIPLMEENRSETSFPLDYLGSQYYTYSRYFNKLPGIDNKENARQMAMNAIGVFEYNFRNNAGPTETLALAYSNHAHILLGFDDHCDNMNRMIAAKEVNQAEMYLNEANKMKRIKNSVEEVYRLNTWGEYHFRRKGYGKANGCFKRGLTIAESMNLKKEKYMCNERLDAVRSCIYLAHVYKVVKWFMCMFICLIAYLSLF